MVAVPQRLEDAVGEAEDEDVLDRLLAEVVIDPVDLVLAEDLRDQLGSGPGRAQVVPERLLDDDARPAALLLGRGRALPRLHDDRRVEARRRRTGRRAGCRAAALALDAAPARCSSCAIERGLAWDRRPRRTALEAKRSHTLSEGGFSRANSRDALAHLGAELVVGHLGARRCRRRRTAPAACAPRRGSTARASACGASGRPTRRR